MKFFVIVLGFYSTCAFAHPGIGIVEDHAGNIFYTDLVHVWKISSDGSKSIAVKNVHTHELFMDENDNLFGEHLWYNGDKSGTWSHFVWKLSSDGNFQKIRSNTDGFLTNYSFVRDHLGGMYWAERNDSCQKVMRQDTDKTQMNLSNRCFSNIRFMKATGTGELLVVDFQDLKKIDTRGNVKTVADHIADKKTVRSSVESQNSVMGVWDDKNGNIYAAVFSARMIKRFSADGKETIAFTSSSPWSPSGGLIDSRGRLWILEYSTTNQVRVQKIEAGKSNMIY